ncbi:MAG: tetratricopeptide repeat protein [Flavobacteriales bacterium]|nr:tetratricopeptide repeat protein [Flavobacteriales bacterium]
MKQRPVLLALLGPLLFAGAGEALAQDLDSLHAVWQDGSRSDSVRVDAFTDYIVEGFLFTEPDSALVLAGTLRSFGQDRSYPAADEIAFKLEGTAYVMLGDYSSATEKYMQGLKRSEASGNRNNSASFLNNLGIIYMDQGFFPRALEYFQKGLRIFEELDNKPNSANCLTNIGIIYYKLKDYPKALDYYDQASRYFEMLEDQGGVANILNNIANIHLDEGDLLRALDKHKESLAIKEKLNDVPGIANSYINIGDVHMELKDYPRAIEYFEMSLKLGRSSGDRDLISISLINIGDAYLAQGRLGRALDFCGEGLRMAEEIDALQEQMSGCACMYNAHKVRGDGDAALTYHERMIAVRDSIFNSENTKKLTELEMRYTFDKKEAATRAEQDKKDAIAAEELRRQKLVRNGFMGGFSLVAVFAVVFFIQRNRIGREKERSDELLLNILPEEVAEELKDTGSAKARHFDMATILFTDFKGFTQASEMMSPQELVEELNTCFMAFDGIITAHGIEKIKTIGDAYMCAGGLPDPSASTPAGVVHAALEMQAFMVARKKERDAQGKPAFTMRAGIHTGPVVAGIVGVKKFAYDIWGDTVNTASRMESSGEVGQVNISEATYALVQNEPGLTFTPRGKVQAKGKGEMEMYFVERT